MPQEFVFHPCLSVFLLNCFNFGQRYSLPLVIFYYLSLPLRGQFLLKQFHAHPSFLLDRFRVLLVHKWLYFDVLVYQGYSRLSFDSFRRFSFCPTRRIFFTRMHKSLVGVGLWLTPLRLLFLHVNSYFFDFKIFRRNEFLLMSCYHFLVYFSTLLPILLLLRHRVVELKLNSFGGTLLNFLNDCLSLSQQHLVIKVDILLF